MPAPTQDLYVYYQVAEEDTAALARRVDAMQAALGIGARKRRPGSSEGRQTWMEVYTGVDAAFGIRLAAAVEAADLAALTSGARHTEIFTDADPTEAPPCA